VNTSEPQGLLVVDKPRGPTSHDVVAEARRLYATRRVGHAGTLDPMATGVLLLLFGEATKLSEYLLQGHKRYRATVRFGSATDTLDAFGRVAETRELEPGWLSRSALTAALGAEAERTLQIPPDYSALKVAGQRAYALARSGRRPELAPRPVEVHGLELTASTELEVTVELGVSKGYYVRSFARDLGQRLGVLAHLAELRRTASGPFSLSEAVPWPPATPVPLLLLADAAARVLPVAHLGPTGAFKAERGQRLTRADFVTCPDGLPLGTAQAWMGPAGELVATGRQAEPEAYVVVRGFGRPRSADDEAG
jgi:tRNA pseudouridine55 synthase